MRASRRRVKGRNPQRARRRDRRSPRGSSDAPRRQLAQRLLEHLGRLPALDQVSVVDDEDWGGFKPASDFDILIAFRCKKVT